MSKRLEKQLTVLPSGKYNKKEIMWDGTGDIAFAILKRNKDKTLQPLTRYTFCRGYLNELSFSVNPQYNELEKDYYKKFEAIPNFFEDIKNFFYLGVRVTNNRQQGFKQNMLDNLDKMVNVIHYFERLFKVPLTQYRLNESKDGTDYYVFRVHKYWIEYAFRMSLYTLIIRGFANYEHKNVTKKLISEHNALKSEDTYDLRYVTKELLNKKQRIKNFKKGKLNIHINNVAKCGKDYSHAAPCHNTGIVRCLSSNIV